MYRSFAALRMTRLRLAVILSKAKNLCASMMSSIIFCSYNALQAPEPTLRRRMNMPKLYVVATPIGNLNDLTPRMRDALESADLIAAEDTRVTMKLLNQFDLKKPMTSCHRHNEEGKAPQIVERMLAEDLTVALTCDAGTPAISDPGNRLVDAAWRAGIRVVPVCGPSATVTALSASPRSNP